MTLSAPADQDRGWRFSARSDHQIDWQPRPTTARPAVNSSTKSRESRYSIHSYETSFNQMVTAR
jgi:hypothetical protein